MTSGTPVFLSPIVADIMAQEGISKEQISGWEVIGKSWFVDVRGIGTYTVDIEKKAVVDRTTHDRK